MARPGEGGAPGVWLKLTMETWLDDLADCYVTTNWTVQAKMTISKGFEPPKLHKQDD